MQCDGLSLPKATRMARETAPVQFSSCGPSFFRGHLHIAFASFLHYSVYKFGFRNSPALRLEGSRLALCRGFFMSSVYLENLLRIDRAVHLCRCWLLRRGAIRSTRCSTRSWLSSGRWPSETARCGPSAAAASRLMELHMGTQVHSICGEPQVWRVWQATLLVEPELRRALPRAWCGPLLLASLYGDKPVAFLGPLRSFCRKQY